MKKLLFCALLFASCSKSNDNTTPPANTNKASLTINGKSYVFDQGATATKATMPGYYALNYSAGAASSTNSFKIDYLFSNSKQFTGNYDGLNGRPIVSFRVDGVQYSTWASNGPNYLPVNLSLNVTSSDTSKIAGTFTGHVYQLNAQGYAVSDTPIPVTQGMFSGPIQ